LNHRDTTTPEPRTRHQPGLPVSLDARSDDHAHVPYAVQARVDQGAGPITLTLYVDGDLVDTDMSTSAVYDFRAADLRPGRHVVTVRAVDGSGRWGGASTVIDLPAPAVP